MSEAGASNNPLTSESWSAPEGAALDEERLREGIAACAASIMHAGTPLDAGLVPLVRGICGAVAAVAGALVIFDAAAHVRAVWSEEGTAAATISSLLDEERMWRLLRSGERHVWTTVDRHGGHPESSGPRTLSIEPVMLSGAHLGAVLLPADGSPAAAHPAVMKRVVAMIAPTVALARRILREIDRTASTAEALDSITRLHQVSNSLAEAITPVEVALAFIHQGMLALDAQAASVAALDPASDTLDVIAAVGIPEDVLDKFRRFPLDARLPLAEAARAGAMILIEDEQTRVARYPEMAAATIPAENKSWAALPLAVGSRVIGAVGFSFAEPRLFHPHDRFFLQTLAQLCTVALDRAIVLEAERRGRIETEASRAHLALIAESSELLATSPDYRAVLPDVAGLATRSADWCIIDLIESGDHIARGAFVHINEEKRGLVDMVSAAWPTRWESDGPLGQALRSGAPYLAAEVTDRLLAEWYAEPAEREAMRNLGIASIIVVPLRARERALGVLALGIGSERPAFVPADLALAVDLARHAALAIDNARLYAEAADAVRRKEESIALLDTILVSAPIGLAFWDEHLRYAAVNQALARMNRLDAPLHIGRTLGEVFPDIAAEIVPILEHVLRSGEPRLEHEYRRLDPVTGRDQYRMASYYPVRSSKGEMLGVGGVLIDVTERKWAEDAIRESEERYRMLVEMAPDVIYSLAADNGSITELSPSFEAVTGWSRSDWLGKSFTGLIHPDDLTAAIQLYTEVLQGLTPPPFELRIRAADGTYLTGEFRSRPQFDGGRVIGEVGIVRDITERTRAHQALRASELQLAGILGSAMDAILTIDADGRIVFFNRAAERMFGCSAEESIGKPAEAFLPARFGLLDEALGGLSRQEMLMPAVPRVSTALGADGAEFPIEATISALEVNGRWLCTVIARDITERHRADLELQQAKSDAEAANSAKDHFLAVLSHELRTPLTPVLAAVQALEVEPHLSDFVQTFLQIIRRNVELEARLIDDLLDLTRISRGKIQLESEVVDLHGVIASVIEICEEDLSKKHFSVPLELEATSHHVVGDSARLQQVLWNLIKNAVKFTPEGGWIAVRTRNVQNGMIEVEVEDSGIGIEGENLDRIFNAFDQGGSPAGGRSGVRSGGLGLGLAISKALVDMHHGTLVAHSRGAGSGSSFFITLPTVEAEADRAAGESVSRRSPGLEGRILLVDDHPDTAQALGLLLRRFGYDVTVADSVASAVAAARRARFDLLVSDIGLPDGTGHDVIREVKKIGPVVGIALSGFGMEDDIRRSLDAGFSEHLIKPVNVGRLHETIQRLLNDRPQD